MHRGAFIFWNFCIREVGYVSQKTHSCCECVEIEASDSNRTNGDWDRWNDMATDMEAEIFGDGLGDELPEEFGRMSAEDLQRR